MAARISFGFALLISMFASVLATSGSALAQADLDAGTYTDPVFNFAFSWDPDLYEATELIGDDDVPYGVHLENELEYGSMSAGGYASPRACLNERSDLFAEIEGVSDMEEAEDLDWPETDPDARAGLYRYEYENPDTGDIGVFVQYFECRDLLMDGEPVEDVVLTFDMGIEEASYEDAVGAWEDILASVEWDVEGGSNGDLEPGLNGNTYVDANDGWAVTWDDSALSAEEWILDEEVGVEGVQLFTESGSFMTIFTEEAQSVRSCVPKQLDAFVDSPFTDFEENDEAELPETVDDARGTVYQGIFTTEGGVELDIYFYAECRPLIIGGEEDEERFLVVNLMTPVDVWEDELPIWSDVLTAIEFDAAGGNTDDSDRDNGESDAGLGDGAYIDPTYGFGVTWRPQQFAASEVLNDDDELVGVSLSTGGGIGAVFWGEYASPDDCVQSLIDEYAATDGVTEFAETDELDPPRSDPDATGVLYTYIWAPNSDVEDPYVRYMECRPMLMEGEPVDGVFLVVRINAEADAYEFLSGEWEDILATIEFDVANGGDDEPTPDDNGRDEPTPDNGGGETGIVGDTYFSALGYEVSWNDVVFTAEYLDEESPDRGIVITSEGSYITIQVAGDPDAAACVEAEVSVLEGFEGMGRFSESDKEGPDAPRDAESELFDATLTGSNGNETDVTVYVECRPLAETDDTPFFIVISMIGFGASYDDELPEWQGILDSIEIG